MLHILFILLKIIGILLAVALGLLLLVLWMPVRYSFQMDKKAEGPLEGQVKVTWFCSLFRMKASYIDKRFDYHIRIFGNQISGNQKEFLDRKKRKEERKEEKRRKKEQASIREEAALPKQEDSSQRERKDPVRDKACGQEENEKPVENKACGQEEDEKPVENKACGQEENEKSDENKACAEGENEKPAGQRKKERKKKKSRKNYGETLWGKYASLRENADKLKNVYASCGGQELKEFFWKSIVQLARHVLPRRWKGYLHFGFDDPAVTGILTGFVAMVYPFGQTSFSLEPDFQQACFDAACQGRGRIHPGFFLWMAGRAVCNKNVRRLLKYIQSA